MWFKELKPIDCITEGKFPGCVPQQPLTDYEIRASVHREGSRFKSSGCRKDGKSVYHGGI